MLTECPSCQTRYELADRLFRRRGRRIRCACCQESWYQLPPDSSKPIFIAPLPITAPVASARSVASGNVTPLGWRPSKRRPQINENRSRPILFRKSFVRAAGIAGCVCLLMLSIGKREQIVRAVPNFGAVYAALGLPVNLRGLEFRNIKSTILSDNGQRFLAVEGFIAQVGKKNATVPDVRVAVRDPSGTELYSWTTPAPKQNLKAGETALFRARLAAPPMAGAQIKVQFADVVPR